MIALTRTAINWIIFKYQSTSDIYVVDDALDFAKSTTAYSCFIVVEVVFLLFKKSYT